jgi:phosphoglycerate dehydrogenase-like enzyme
MTSRVRQQLQEFLRMADFKVAFIHGLAPELVHAIVQCTPSGFKTVSIEGTASDEALIEAVKDADFIMIYRAKPKDSVRAAKRTKLVQLLSAGYDMLKVDLLRELSLPLANNSGANSWAVADHSVLAMLALYRRLIPAHTAVRDGEWSKEIDGTNTFEMANKLVGIIGLGNIGSKVAKRVQAFDAHVQYYNPEPRPHEEEERLNVKWVPLDELFRTSDIISLHIPLNDHTRGLVGREQLAMMKRTVVLINTARGEVVDEAALAEVLEKKQILGAGLDAFSPEPVPDDSPFLKLDNVVLSPHSAGTTWDTWTRRGQFAYQNFQRVLSGVPAEGLV